MGVYMSPPPSESKCVRRWTHGCETGTAAVPSCRRLRPTCMHVEERGGHFCGTSLGAANTRPALACHTAPFCQLCGTTAALSPTTENAIFLHKF